MTFCHLYAISKGSRISAVGMTTNVLELCHFIYRVMLVHGMQVLIQKHLNHIMT
jgi:hypothetical protein